MPGVQNSTQPPQSELHQQVESMYEPVDANKLLERLHQSVERPTQGSGSADKYTFDILNHMLTDPGEQKTFKRAMAEQLKAAEFALKENIGDLIITFT